MIHTDFLLRFIPVVLSKPSLQKVMNTTIVGLVVFVTVASTLLQKDWHVGDFIDDMYLSFVTADVVWEVNAV